MAYSARLEVFDIADGWIVRVHETDAQPDSETRIPLPTYGTIVSVRSRIVSGPASIAVPAIGALPGWSAGSIDELYRAVGPSDLRAVPYVAPLSAGWLRTSPNVGATNRVVTEILIERGFRESRELRPRGHLASVRDAVSLYDPSGIVVSGTSLHGGAVRMSLSGAPDCNTPVTGATYSVPLRDVTGRPFGPIQSAVKGGPPFVGAFWLREISQWLNHAAPSNAAHWVGIGSAPFEGVSTPGDWIFWLVQNHAAGVQRVAQMDRESSDAPDLRTATSGHPTIRGVRGGFGSVSGWHDNETYASGVTYPYEHEGPANLAYRVLNTNALRFPQGSVPHLYFGAGCDGVADVTEFAAGGICVSVVDPYNLTAR